MMQQYFKRFTCFILIGVITLNSNLIALANETVHIDSNQITASYVSELSEMEFSDIENLSADEVNIYFEKAFLISADYYSIEDKISALKAVSTFQKFRTFARASSTTSSLSSYTGNKGVAWVRDTGNSPLTLAEALSGTYTLEVDYLTYKYAITLYAAGSDYNFFTSLKNAATTAVASTLICNKLGISNMTIPSAVISAVVSLGWDIVNSLDRSNMKTVIDKMSYSNMMQVSFMTANNYLTKVYSLYSPTAKYNSSSDNFTYKNLKNPCSGKYGNWYANHIGYLYSY